MSVVVLNPGFETVFGNDFADWAEVIAGATVFDNTTFPHSGLHAAQLGFFIPGIPFPIPVSGGLISQPIAIPPNSGGNTYTLSFWAAAFDFVGILGVSLISLLPLPTILINANVNVGSVQPGFSPYALHTIDFVLPANPPDSVMELTFTGLGGTVILIDDVSITQAVICYAGESLVHTKDIATGKIEDIEAKNVYSGVHEVFSVNKNEFIPVKLNVVSGLTKDIRLIKKDALGENQPSQDLYITSGHRIVINGVSTKVRRIPQAKRVKRQEPILVYSICVDKHQPILVNNLPVIAWGHDEWLQSSRKKAISWKNNTQQQ